MEAYKQSGLTPVWLPSLGVWGAFPSSKSGQTPGQRSGMLTPHQEGGLHQGQCNPAPRQRGETRQSASPPPHVLELDSDSERSSPGDSPYRLPEHHSLNEEAESGFREDSLGLRRTFALDRGLGDSVRGCSGEGASGGVPSNSSSRKRKSRWGAPDDGLKGGYGPESADGLSPAKHPKTGERNHQVFLSDGLAAEDSGVSERLAGGLGVTGPLPTCPICLNDVTPKEKAVLRNCMHVFCAGCIRAWSEIRRQCPLCKAVFTGWWYDILGEASFKEMILPPPPQNVSSAAGGNAERRNRLGRGSLSQTVEERFSARPYYYRLQRGLHSDRRRAPGGSNRADEQRTRQEGGRRTEPVPRQRFFTQGEEGAEERALRWRRSVYDRGLEAVVVSGPGSRAHEQQDPSRSQRRLAPWIERELRALLGDADPLVSQLVTSLWRSAAEAQPREDADRRAVAQLEAFLGERAGAFWHELRCFAQSPFTMHTYDCVAQYRRRGALELTTTKNGQPRASVAPARDRSGTNSRSCSRPERTGDANVWRSNLEGTRAVARGRDRALGDAQRLANSRGVEFRNGCRRRGLIGTSLKNARDDGQSGRSMRERPGFDENGRHVSGALREERDPSSNALCSTLRADISRGVSKQAEGHPEGNDRSRDRLGSGQLRREREAEREGSISMPPKKMDGRWRAKRAGERAGMSDGMKAGRVIFTGHRKSSESVDKVLLKQQQDNRLERIEGAAPLEGEEHSDREDHWPVYGHH